MAEIRLRIAEAERKLPRVCVCCGDEATLTKPKKMSWHPQWLFVLVLFGLIGIIVYAILAATMSKRVLLQTPLCERHRYHWTARSMAIGISFLLLIPVFVGAIVMSFMSDVRGGWAETLVGPLWLTVLALFVGWLIFMVVVQQTAVRTKEITDREIVLQGVSAEFVEAMADWDRERRERRRREREYEDEDEEEAPAPVKKASSATEVQDKTRRRTRRDEDDEE